MARRGIAKEARADRMLGSFACGFLWLITHLSIAAEHGSGIKAFILALAVAVPAAILAGGLVYFYLGWLVNFGPAFEARARRRGLILDIYFERLAKWISISVALFATLSSLALNQPILIIIYLTVVPSGLVWIFVRLSFGWIARWGDVEISVKRRE